MDNAALKKVGADAQEISAAQALIDRTDHKAQLRKSVEARVDELEQTLAGIERQSDRGQALLASIQTARDCVGIGWERMSDTEAARLSHWLEKTEDLRVTSPGLPSIKPI